MANGITGSQPADLARINPVEEEQAQALEQAQSAPQVNLSVGTPQPTQGEEASLTEPTLENLTSFLQNQTAPEIVENAVTQLKANMQQPTVDQMTRFLQRQSIAQARDKQMLTSKSDDLEESGLRAGLSFARTDKEKLGFLQDTFGTTNARKVGDAFQWRASQSDEWKPVDSDDFDFFNDLVADNARMLAEFGIELPAAALGALGGAAAGTLVAPGVGTAGGLLAGGAAGAATANTVGDFVAEKFFGIERDPSRSRLDETGDAALLGAAFSVAGPAFRTIAKSVRRGSKAAQAATTGTNLDKADIGFKEARKISEELKGTGLQTSVDAGKGRRVTIPLTAAGIKDPQFEKLSKSLNALPEKRQLDAELWDLWRGNVNKLTKAMGNASDLVSPGTTVSRGTVQDLGKVVNNARLREGQFIGDMRKRAGEFFKDNHFAMRETEGAIDDLLQESLQVSREGDRVVGMTTEAIQEAFALDSPIAAKRFSSELNKITENLFNNEGMKIDQLSSSIKRLDQLASTGVVKKDPTFRRAILKLNSSLRKDRRDAMTQALPSNLAGEFQESSGRFAKIQDLMSEASDILDTDKLTSNAVVKGLFSQGKGGLADAKALKAVLEFENPQAWDDLKGEFLDQIIEKSSSGGKPLSLSAYAKNLNGLGKEYAELLTEGTAFKPAQMKAILNQAARIEKQMPSNPSATELDKASQAIVSGMSEFRSARLNALRSLFDIMVNRKELRKHLLDNGIDEYLNQVPKTSRELLRSKFDMVRATLKGTVKAATRPVPGLVRGQARQEVLNE